MNSSPTPSAPLAGAIKNVFLSLLPAPVTLAGRERLRVVAGAAIGVGLAALLSHSLAGVAGIDGVWMVASLGASAVLVFAAPAGPMAQPWAAVAGNTVSAVVGIACVRWIGEPAFVVAALAASLSIAAMFSLRCLHPPGGAVALTAVLLQVHDFRFALFPVAVNTLLLVLAGSAFHRATGRRYPHSQQPAKAPAGEIPSRFNSADFDKALARYNEVLDVSRDDLEGLLRQTELNAYHRLFGGLRCADIMSREPVTVQFGDGLQDAWALMRRHHVKALPVTDRGGRIAGIVTQADFLRQANLDAHEGLGERVKELVRSTGTLLSTKPEVVGQIMTRRVRVAREDRLIVDLVASFSADGHHHLPIVDADSKLVGIITQSDFVRALARVIEPEQAVAR
ncbi:HPP family protein [Nevskia ramosa]|uniref:HPP family protein n=1 Tax=Nevskia ramosa TaxID=64002 RepID=UPI0003B5D4FF|nr:HPP family protein [Nevskia ramosa]